jgi:putative nucleotidyltransferase with HDIG domain
MGRSRRLLLGATYVVGIASIAYAAGQGWPLRSADAVAFIALVYVCDWLPIMLPRGGSTSVAFAIYTGALVVFGPAVPVIAAVITAFHHVDIRGRKPVSLMLFNAGQFAASIVAMDLVFVGLGGHFLAVGQSARPIDLANAVAALAGAMAFFVVNTSLVVNMLALIYSERPSRVWVENFRWLVSNYVALALVGLLLAATYVAAGTPGVLLLVAPLLIARQTFVMYLRRREAYYQTVHSLVASIEAKDPYTRGHSERVAQYAGLIAEAMNLDADDMEMLRFAALLHDLGKIGIARDILNKPASLSPEEYRVIQEHPDIAARIIGRIKFLEAAIPGVLAHHERLDGIGYGHGLRASEVPLFARILAVADCFDAMTSERPYRSSLTRQEAVKELIDNRGTQFDATVVDAFLRAMNLQDLVEQPESREQLSLIEAAG